MNLDYTVIFYLCGYSIIIVLSPTKIEPEMSNTGCPSSYIRQQGSSDQLSDRLAPERCHHEDGAHFQDPLNNVALSGLAGKSLKVIRVNVNGILQGQVKIRRRQHAITAAVCY